MVSNTRAECIYHLGECKKIIKEDYYSVLEIGTDGDALPSGNHPMFNYVGLLSWMTLDKLPNLAPTFVFDLETERWEKERAGLVICSNVLEHTKDLTTALDNVVAMSDDWLIVDMPNSWEGTPFHGTKDYGDWHRLNTVALGAMLVQRGFKIVWSKDGNYVSTVLARRE